MMASTTIDEVGGFKDLFQRYGKWVLLGFLIVAGLVFKNYFTQEKLVFPSQNLYQAYHALIKLDPNTVEWGQSAEKFLNSYPNNAYAGFVALNQAKNLVEQKNWLLAIEKLNWVLNNKALSGVHDITRLRLAKVQWAAGQIDQAIKTLEAKHSDVYDVLYQTLKGDIYLSQNQNQLAAKAYGDAIKRDTKQTSTDQNQAPVMAENSVLGIDPFFKFKHNKAQQGE
ncbi:MAG: YfgM family protein [Gammaproteobacteria bacterium]